MEIVLNGRDTVVLEDQQTRRGYRVVSSTGDVFNPDQGLVVYIEDPLVGAYPWVSYVRVGSDGLPDLWGEPASRLQLRKSKITHVTT